MPLTDPDFMTANPLRAVPSVNEVLEVPAVKDLAGAHAHEDIVAAIRAELAELRRQLGAGQQAPSALVELIAVRVVECLGRAQQPTLRTVINATGIVLHTNLGRAPLAEVAAQAALEAA